MSKLNELSWEDRHPSNYESKPIYIPEFPEGGSQMSRKKLAGEYDLRPVSIWQRLLFASGRTATLYPVRCGLCGVETKGNIIRGYRMGCDCHWGA